MPTQHPTKTAKTASAKKHHHPKSPAPFLLLTIYCYYISNNLPGLNALQLTLRAFHPYESSPYNLRPGGAVEGNDTDGPDDPYASQRRSGGGGGKEGQYQHGQWRDSGGGGGGGGSGAGGGGKKKLYGAGWSKQKNARAHPQYHNDNIQNPEEQQHWAPVQGQQSSSGQEQSDFSRSNNNNYNNEY